MAKRSRFFWFLVLIAGMIAGCIALGMSYLPDGNPWAVAGLTIIGGSCIGMGLGGSTYRPIADAIVRESSRDFKRDLRAYADGDMTIERFVALWSGNVPPKPKVCGPAPVRAVSDQADTLKKFLIRIGADAEFRPAQWVRLKATGELAQVLREAYWAGEAWFYELSGPRHAENRTIARATDIEPALPKAGEWWIKDQCVRDELHGGHWLYAPFEWKGNYPISRPDEMAVNCGCLNPENFGKGYRNDPPGPRFNKGQWARVALVTGDGNLVWITDDPIIVDGRRHYRISAVDGSRCVLAESSLERAYPRRGEWWVKKPCPQCDPGVAWSHEPYESPFDFPPSPLDRKSVECGCRVPWNWGKPPVSSGGAGGSGGCATTSPGGNAGSLRIE